MSLDVWKEPDKRTPPSTMKVMIQRTAHPGMSIIGVLGDLCQLFPTPPDLKQNKTFCVLKTRAFFPLSAPSTIALPWQGKHLAAMAVWHPQCRIELTAWGGAHVKGDTGWTGGNFSSLHTLGIYLKGLAKNHWRLSFSGHHPPCFGES